MNLCILGLYSFLALLGLELAAAASSITTYVSPMSDLAYDEYTYVASGWDYDTVKGPLLWGDFWDGCHMHAGTTQSPINLINTLLVKSSTSNLNVCAAPGYNDANLCLAWPKDQLRTFLMMNNPTEHTVKLIPPNNQPSSTKIETASGSFQLVDIHFRTPSEHRYRDEQYSIEAHFVMENTDVNGTPHFIVRGLFFDVSQTDESDFWTDIAPSLRCIEQPWNKVELQSVNIENIMRLFHDSCQNGEVLHYVGSLTTPPCHRDVSWFFLRTPQAVSVATYKSLRRIMRFNARYTQNYPGESNLLAMACHSKVPQ
ncbi:alpha carbonic anhydrase [Tirmania nivea]|nr:alpha carbonic anhydrase [Tirmania nivea]